MPQTQLGRWSVRFAGAFVALFVLAQIVATVGRSQGAFEPERTTFYAILFPGIIIPAAVAGIAAYITGLMSIIKYQEQSWLVYIALSIGFSVMIYIFGEFLFPH